MFRKISQNSLGNTCSEVPSSIKLKTWSPKACHFTTQRTPLQVFSREFWEIFRLSCFWRKLTNDWFWRVHISDWLYQKQPPEMLYKKSYSWKFHNIHKKTPASEPLYDNIAGFVKKRLQHKCFPVNTVKFLRTLILNNICERLLLYLREDRRTNELRRYSQLSFIKKTLSAV